MRIIDAYWEKCNLGFKTCEIIFQEGERIESYQKKNLEKSYEYIVAKIPAGELKLIHELEDIGFKFIEDQFIISINPLDHKFKEADYLKHFGDVSYIKVKEQKDLCLINSNVAKGMFTYDRISMDPFFNKVISSIRISNWLIYLFSRSNFEFYFLTVADKKVGFFVIENCKQKKVSITFAGLFNEHQNTGLAYFLVYNTMKLAVEKDARVVEAVFSSNNKNMFNIIARIIRFRIENNYIVLRKII